MAQDEFQWLPRGDGELVLYHNGQICSDRDVIAAQRERKKQADLAKATLASGK